MKESVVNLDRGAEEGQGKSASPASVVASDPVNHPAHYAHGRIEVIEAIEDWKLGFHEGNAVKYIARAAHKGNRKQDLEKAAWFLNRLITKLSMEPAGLAASMKPAVSAPAEVYPPKERATRP